EKELGYKLRRDELFVLTHTHKNGLPAKDAESTINELQEAATIFPELKDRTIQEGDPYSSVLGEKEPRGCVCGLGLGPTPQGIGTPGARSYVPTRFQMAIVGQQQSAQEVVLKGRVDHMQQEIDVLKQMVLVSQGAHNVETNSHRGSNSQHHVSSSLQPCLGEEQDDHHDDADIGLSAENIPINDDQRTVLNRQAALPRASTRTNASPPNNHAARRPDSSSQVGRDVILYSTVAPATPVAKATIVSTNPTNIVGGESLGQQYYEVVINMKEQKQGTRNNQCADWFAHL
ncbi:hypothetical protein E2562_014320, partial [Oryza meyeriana var. granulata]